MKKSQGKRFSTGYKVRYQCVEKRHSSDEQYSTGNVNQLLSSKTVIAYQYNGFCQLFQQTT